MSTDETESCACGHDHVPCKENDFVGIVLKS